MKHILNKLTVGAVVLVLIFSGCNKQQESPNEPANELKVLTSVVHHWYDSIRAVNKIPQQNLVSTFSATNGIAEPDLQITNLLWDSAFMHYDSANTKGLTVPIYINEKTGEFTQLATVNEKGKVIGYLVKTVLDSGWNTHKTSKTNYCNSDGTTYVYTVGGRFLTKATFKNGKIVLNAAKALGNSTKISASNATFGFGDVQQIDEFVLQCWLSDPDNYVYFYLTNTPGSWGPGAANFIPIVPFINRIWATPPHVNPEDPGENFQFNFGDDTAIELVKYFKCFDNVPDAGATYSVKLCADIPVNNEPDDLINNSLEPGHSFVTMTKTNGSNSVTQSFGFYPVPKYVSALMITVSSKIVDNGSGGNEHEYNASIEAKNISQLDFQSLQNIALSRANLMKYDLNNYNCTNYALDVYNFINPNNPLVVSDWLGKGGNTQGGFNYKKTPNGLYKVLSVMTNNPNVKVGVLNAPTGHGQCN